MEAVLNRLVSRFFLAVRHGLCQQPLPLFQVPGRQDRRRLPLLKRADEIICTVLDSEEIIREVWERMRLEINFREGVERIREVEKA